MEKEGLDMPRSMSFENRGLGDVCQTRYGSSGFVCTAGHTHSFADVF